VVHDGLEAIRLVEYLQSNTCKLRFIRRSNNAHWCRRNWTMCMQEVIDWGQNVERTVVPEV
jgi:hypothetical protein